MTLKKIKIIITKILVSRTSKSVVTNSHNHFGEGMSDVERKKKRKLIKIKIPVTQAICNHEYPQPSLKENKKRKRKIILVSRTSNP
jgi:hypothetical protein